MVRTLFGTSLGVVLVLTGAATAGFAVDGRGW
jgi:hypothetical protein